MVKILITTIQVNFVPFGHHSHFLAATLDFTSFFTLAFLRAALFFTAGCFGFDNLIQELLRGVQYYTFGLSPTF